MDSWPSTREIEKPKNRTEKRIDARKRGQAVVSRLIEVEKFIVGVWGHNSPLLSEVRDARAMIVELIELVGPVL